MPISFLPSSTFGVYGLSQLLESNSSYLVAQLLYVPAEVPGDRTEWTWQNNWKNYVVAGAFSGTGGSLNLSTIGETPPATVALYEQATSEFAGAYSDLEYAPTGPGYVIVSNNTTTAYTYNYVAVFALQPSVTTLNALVLPDESLYCVSFVIDPETEEPAILTLDPYVGNLFSFSTPGNSGGATFTIAEGFDGWVAADAATTTFETPPYPVITFTGYYMNLASSPNVLSNFKNLLGINFGDNITSFLAELLNVTGTEPDFEEGWDGWSPYRINRYSTVPFVPNFTFTERTETFERTLDGTDYSVDDIGIEVSYANKTEFVFTAPASGSYTYTHIAVFVNEVDTPPLQESVYTYANPNKLVGVIKLPASVTMTTSSAPRAYPFRFSYMYQLEQAYTEVGG